MKNRAVVFDMDGVILDTERLAKEAWVELSGKYGVTGMEEVYRQCVGVTENFTREVFRRAYGEQFPYDRFRSEADAQLRGKSINGRLPVKAGVVELLEYLKSNGYMVGLASSTRRELVEEELGAVDLLKYFEKLTCGDMVEKSKPQPDIYLTACKRLGVDPRESIAIEDSFNGIRSCHAAGMYPVMVPDQLPPDEEMKQLAANIFSNLYEVKAWLEDGGPAF